MSVPDMHGDGARPPGRGSSRFLRTKRTWGVLIAAAVLAIGIAMPAVSFADNVSGCDFAANGTTESCSGPLAGSTFAGGDGNLLTSPTTFGTTDWQNVAGRNTGIDLPSGTGDNSFGQGTKEDNSSVTVVTGSIPPNKSDLTRFYEASELLRWVTSGSTSQCFSSNSLPCWGNHVTLNGTDSIGAVNNLGPVTDPFVPNAPNNIGALRFGEAAINLTAAGVFPAGTCQAFGSAFLKSRSSSSFPAEVKDFIAPVPVNISNCGEVKIIKNTDPRNLDQDFSYTSTIPNPTDPTADPRTPQCSTDPTPSSFTLNDKTGGVNTEDCVNVPAGKYTVLEGAEPANFTLESLTCKVDGTGGSTGSQDASNPFQADITLNPNDTVTCTYVNQASGAIQVTKTAKNHNFGDGAQHPLAGATFTVNGVSQITDANGLACFDGLTIGKTYTVTETSAPSGYSIDTASKDVTVSKAASCTSGTPDAVSFTDSPLTDISANATSEVPGATNSTITCVDANGKTVADSGALADPANASAKGLTPGTYKCTITIDP